MKIKRKKIIKDVKNKNPLIRFEDFLLHFEGRFTRGSIQMLRFRWKLFPPTIIRGRVGAKGGVDGYLCRETIDYLEKIIKLKKEGKTYSKIDKMLQKEKEEIFKITEKQKRKQFYLTDQSLKRVSESIEELERLAERCNQKIFQDYIIDGYRETMQKLLKEEKNGNRKELEKLLIVYVRFFRAAINTCADMET